ncbi:mucin-17 [Pristis pectinata]|uniref:mucin-17 n=1 Tax=Pristis pectinata TaxID=685728 RepID=UPI00223C8C11|nr:mucin-17 [Pristis pectinata]
MYSLSTKASRTTAASSEPHSTTEVASSRNVPLRTVTTATKILPSSSAYSSLPVSSHPKPTISTLGPVDDYCSKCHCLNGGSCNSSATTKDHCVCQCPSVTYGSLCQYGYNHTIAIPNPRTPKRIVTLTLWLNGTWNKTLEDPSGVEYGIFLQKLIKELTPLYKKASPENFYKVTITELRKGSIIAKSNGLYNYTNNQTEINYLNKHLAKSLLVIFNNTATLKNLSDQLGVGNMAITHVDTPVPLVKSIRDLNFTCEIHFHDYTASCSNGNYCVCEGPCKRYLDFCHRRGKCFNQVNGPTCECFHNTFYQYMGKNCEMSIRSSGFYGVLFGVLAGALLLLIVIITVIVYCRRNRNRHLDPGTPRKWYSIDEEYFRFPQTDIITGTSAPNTGKVLGRRRGRYSLDKNPPFNDFGSGVWRPNLDKVDTEAEIRAKRPKVVMPDEQ